MKIARFNRLFNPQSHRCFDVAIDHEFFNQIGFLAGIENLPRTVATLVEAEPRWEKTDLGFSTPFRTVTDGISEPGFPDVLMQMWAAFLSHEPHQVVSLC